MNRTLLGSVLVLLVALAGVARAADAPYRLASRLAIGGEGGWDYLLVDAAAHRVFVSRGTHVQVVDLATGKLAADIPGTEGVHGIALAPEFGAGFTSNGRGGNVTVFDLATLKPTGTIAIGGKNPDAILYEPVSKRVFTFNGGSANATAIDAATRSVAGTVTLTGKPEFAVAEGTGRVFVNIEDRGAITVFDARTLKVEATWPIAGCEEPNGLAIDRSSGRLFAGCGNKVMAIVDSHNGKVVATVPIGAGVDATVFDPITRLAFSSNGAGSLTVVHEDSPDAFTVLADVPTQRSARTMALDESTHRIYLPAAEFGPAPAPTAEHPRPRGAMVAGSFVLLVMEPVKR